MDFDSTDVSSWTLPNLAATQAGKLGNRTFIDFADGSTVTYEDLDLRARHIGRLLVARGIAPGDRVMVMLSNSREFLLLMFATFHAGAIFVPLNTELKGAFLEHQVRNSAPALVFAEEEYLARFDGHIAREKVICATEGSSAEGEDWASFLAGRACDPVDLVVPSSQDTAVIMYTSGTTGPAKGVMLPHCHICLFFLPYIERFGICAEDRYFICMPFFHANALFLQVCGLLSKGGTAHVVRRFSASNWVSDVRKSRATVTHLLGAMGDFVLKQPETPEDSQNDLRLILAVPVSEAFARDLPRRFGATLIQGYGSTESNMLAWSQLDDGTTPGRAGHVNSDWFDVIIADPDTDMPLGTDQIGEILARPKLPGGFMQGYWDMPDRTVKAWRNLWYHTGDAGRIDSENRLWFVDRLRDRIRRRGENITAYEIEQALLNHDAVKECAVIGIRTPESGGEEDILAVIVFQDGADLAFEEIRAFAEEAVPRYAVPRFLMRMPALPVTASGKIQKQVIRDNLDMAVLWDADASAQG